MMATLPTDTEVLVTPIVDKSCEAVGLDTFPQIGPEADTGEAEATTRADDPMRAMLSPVTIDCVMRAKCDGMAFPLLVMASASTMRAS